MNAITKLGMGMMRLPQVNKEVDQATTNQMADIFLEAGGVWFDTAWGYHNGKSEPAVYEAAVARHPREGFKVATKLPVWLVKAQGGRGTAALGAAAPHGRGLF